MKYFRNVPTVTRPSSPGGPRCKRTLLTPFSVDEFIVSAARPVPLVDQKSNDLDACSSKRCGKE